MSKLNSVLSKQKVDSPGVSALVKKNNEVIFQFSKGLANKDKNIYINAQTGFRIGSISKPFTALAIMTLVEQKKLSLDDEVTMFIKGLSSRWQGITIRHLITHRVYLSKNFFSASNLASANYSTNKDLVRFISSEKIKVHALAIDKAIYCNSCFVLLAEVVAEVSGISFSDYLTQHIFTPANMPNTYIIESGKKIKLGDALNYAKTESFSGIKQYTTGAMAQVSNIEDMNNFIGALKRGEIISHATHKLMTKAHSDAGNDGVFGLGWMVGSGSNPFYSHGGSQDGYQSELFFYPKHELEVVILTNGGDETYQLQAKMIRTIITHYK